MTEHTTFYMDMEYLNTPFYMDMEYLNTPFYNGHGVP